MTRQIGIALDLGTSGLRAQAMDPDSGRILSTAITVQHPLPGANVVDHLHFALETGVVNAQRLILRAVNRLGAHLRIPTDSVVRLAVCGNPIQLSLFQGIDIRDLAFAGRRKLQALGVQPIDRGARILAAKDLPLLNLPASCDIIIPPAVRHEIGADALAMVIQTGILEKEETAMATDYGTNAEMALVHNGRIFTASTAAGPAIEGQQIAWGMLAAPGAIADLLPDKSCYRLVLLDDRMQPIKGGCVDLEKGADFREPNPPHLPVGITGTGTIALVFEAMRAGLIEAARIKTSDHLLHLGPDISFSETDLAQAGKAFGAVRAGHIVLCRQAGIEPRQIQTAYLSGASGTYVDALKARKLGLIPPRVKTIYQVGNTSLAMARDLLTEPAKLEAMSRLAGRLRKTHCMLAGSALFQKVYILELSHWTEGMPMALYRSFLKKYGLPDYDDPQGGPRIVRLTACDIGETGTMGLVTLKGIGETVCRRVDHCTFCLQCVAACPTKALGADSGSADGTLCVHLELCEGIACRRCERACPENVFNLTCFFTCSEKPEEVIAG